MQFDTDAIKNDEELIHYFNVNDKDFCQYHYRNLDGKLFTVIKPTLEQCRAERDTWVQNLNLHKT